MDTPGGDAHRCSDDTAVSAHDILPALRLRASPLRFDDSHVIGVADVELLLEAARWAPSAGNSQPWAFVTARRGESPHGLIVKNLAASAARWAPDASLLVVNLNRRVVPGTDWAYSEFADYDLGQAVAHLVVQAQSMGLSCRQFRAFDLDTLTADLQVPPEWQIVTITAIGKGSDYSPDRRQRRDLVDLRTAPFALSEERPKWLA
jgi:nitroreductase